MIDHTHDAAATSWVPGEDEHADFPIQNLPLGVFANARGPARIGTAIGAYVLDLAGAAQAGLLPADMADSLTESTLNGVFSHPKAGRVALRHAVFELLSNPARRDEVERHLIPATQVEMQVPFRIGDYTDFYAGIHHATNIGKLFRPDNPLLPNYKHVPIGYHGRASSIRASGTPVVRPNGQRKGPDDSAPTFGPCQRLDYELELGIWIAQDNALGQPVPIDQTSDRIAGLCLLNDWSARDIQAWEYQPLGPFLAKNFVTTVSPWVITAEALAPFRIAQAPRPEGDPAPLPYLWDKADQQSGAFALTLEVFLSTANMRSAGLPPHRLSCGPASNLYWTIAQMIAHHASGGCNLETGDLLGTGTISGPEKAAFGSLMELSSAGKDPVVLPDGESRTFLQDGDEVSLVATATAPGRRSIGFGPCRGAVEAAP